MSSPLSQGRWRRVSPELDLAFDLPPERRAAWFEALRARDAALAAEVEALLWEHEQLAREGFLEGELGPPAGASLAGQAIGAYTLRELLGQGGMGSVWRAERSDGRFEGLAAVKLLNASLLGQASEARFRQEGRILARLQHPNVARLLDAGLSPLGQPYLVLEYVDGERIDAYCDARRLGVEARVRLFSQVLEAVAHAHANLIVHRDIKPSNVLVTAEGQVKLLDFGIAKLLEVEAGPSASTPLTREGGLAFTPDYAAPEQILGEPLSTTTDVYALGVLLMELLSGARPYRPAGPARRDLEEAVMRQEPLRPSQVRSPEAARARGLTPEQLSRRLRGDLDAIVLKALEKAPAARYRDVGAMADDLERYATLRPVLARSASRLGRLGRFVRRNGLALGLASAVTTTLSAATAAALWQARRANAEAEAARQATARADAVQNFLVGIFEANGAEQDDPAKARATTARELLDLGARRVDGDLAKSPEARLKMLSLLSEMYRDLGLDDEAVSIARRAVAQSVELYGERDVQTVRELMRLSSALHASNSYAERGEVLARAAAVIEALPPHEIGVRAMLEGQLSEHLQSSNREQALAHAERAVELYRRTDDAEALASVLSILGQRYGNLERADEAIPAYRESIALFERETHGTSPTLTLLYTHLAESETTAGEFASAERHFQDAIAAALRRQGPAHVDALQTRLRFGVFLSRTEQWRAALDQLGQARALALQLKGPRDAFHVPPARGEYGIALARAGEPEAGLLELQGAIEARRAGRPGTLFLAQLLANEASALIDLGRDDEARGRLDEAEAILAKGQPGRPAYAVLINARARLLVARGELGAAERSLAEYDAQLQSASAKSPTHGPGLWLGRAEVALARGDLDAALAQARRAKEAFPDDERYYGARRARYELVEGSVALERQRPAEALPWLQKALERRLGLFHPGALAVADAQIALARAKLALGRLDEARALHRQAQAIHAQHAEAPAFNRRPLEALGAALAGAK